MAKLVLTVARKRGERKRKGWSRKKDDRHQTKRQLEREKRKKKKESVEPAFPSTESPEIQERFLLSRLEEILSSVRSGSSYRMKNGKKIDFSAMVGFTSNTLGLKGFEMLHPQPEQRGLGICINSPENRKISNWLRKIWSISKLLLPLYDRNYGEEYCVHVSRMSKKANDSIHRDGRDVAPAMVVYLGAFSNASLILYDKSGKEIVGRLLEPYQMASFDPRLPHQVERGSKFQGVRYSVIFFKMWRHVDCFFQVPIQKLPRYLVPRQKIQKKPLPKVSRKGTKLYFSWRPLFLSSLVRREGTRLFFLVKHKEE